MSAHHPLIDFVTIGTVLIHPDGECTVTDQTRTSWKAQRRGQIITIAKDTMVERGNDVRGYAGRPFVTRDRAEQTKYMSRIRREIGNLMENANLGQLEGAWLALGGGKGDAP